MPQRIVVCFRGAVGASEHAAADYLARALATKKRAEAHGATLCAWSAHTFSFELAPDELEEALALAALANPASGGGGAPNPPADAGFMVGLAQGALDAVGEASSFSALSWGPALVAAVSLSRDALAGEVLLDAPFVAARSAELVGLGWIAEPELRRGVLLLRRAPPPSAVAVPQVSTPVISAAQRALEGGDAGAIDRVVADLRGSEAGTGAAERLAGIAALRRGATGEALRWLRAAAEADQPPARRARARLGYAVALAAAGRAEPALLEALAALARAREAKDVAGEAACARFLAEISRAEGQAAAGDVWARLAGIE